MEDLIILILSGLGEFLFEVFAYMPWDLFFYGREPERPYGIGAAFLFAGITIGAGALVGYVFTLFCGSVLVKWAWLRITLLFVSPLLSGTVAYLMARRREKVNDVAQPWFHFWVSFGFSFGVVATRFVLAHRPA